MNQEMDSLIRGLERMHYLPPRKGRVRWLLQLIRDLEGAANVAHEKGKNAYARGLVDGRRTQQ